MSMARHTWRRRNVLCIADDGPSTDLRQIHDEPLDRAQIDNIGATIETMDSVERMTFMTSLLRFLMEISQQVCSIMLTAPLPDRARPPRPESDEHSLMQNFVAKPTPQDEYGYLQHSLDKSSSHRHHKAKFLLEYFLAADDLRTNPDAQQIIAMLLVYRDEVHPDQAEPAVPEDHQWAINWWRKLRCLPTLRVVPERGEGSDRAAIAPPLMVHVDDSDSLPMPHAVTAAPSDGSFMARTNAHRFQQWEDWAVHSEMHAVPARGKRTRVDVEISNGTCSSRATLRLQGQALQRGLQVRLQLREEGGPDPPNETQDLGPADETGLVQGRIRGHGIGWLLQNLQPEGET